MWLYTFHACAEREVNLALNCLREILYKSCFYVIWYVAGYYIEWDSL
jgi:hypothetical protein